MADLALDNLNDDGFLKDGLDVGADLKMRRNIVLGRSASKINAMGSKFLVNFSDHSRYLGVLTLTVVMR